MRINNLTCTSGFKANSLDFAIMKDLKQMVVLFGRNGAGKTRLLGNISSHINEREQEYQNALAIVADPSRKNGADWSAIYDKNLKIIEAFKADIEIHNNEKGVVEIFPYNDQIQDQEIPDSNIRQLLNDSVSNPRFNEIKKNALNLIKSLCKSEIAHTFYLQNTLKKGFYKVHNDLVERNKRLLNVISHLIEDVLGKRFHYITDEHLNPIVILNNWPIHRMDLSSGEQSLLAYCIFIAFQSEKIRNNLLV